MPPTKRLAVTAAELDESLSSLVPVKLPNAPKMPPASQFVTKHLTWPLTTCTREIVVLLGASA